MQENGTSLARKKRSIESAFKKHSRDMTDYKTIVIVA